MVELIETLTNEHLYPPLLEVPDDNSDLADALEFFEDDIADVSAFVLEFFANDEEGGPGGDFAADFATRLAGEISQHPQKEEPILYRIYEKL